MAKDVETFINDLSREMHIEGIQGLLGNELELISLVRNCQFLYDRTRPDFKDYEVKESAWQAISKVMQAPVNDCKFRWRSLRDQYNRLRKDSDERCTSWEFYEDMKFIEPYIKPRRFNYLSKDRQTILVEPDQNNFEFSEEWLDDTEQYNGDFKEKLFKLIEAVKQQPIIYSKSSVGHRDKSKKLEAWLEIAQQVGAPLNSCQAKWRGLRERFGRERKHQSDNEEKNWEYFDSLSFLDKHVKERRSSTMYRKILPKSSTSALLNNNPETILVSPVLLENEDNSTINTVEYINTTFTETEPICSSPCSETNNSSFNNDLKEIKRNEFRSSSSTQSQDEDDLFGQAIAAELKRIRSCRKKMKIKADMYKLLYDAESD